MRRREKAPAEGGFGRAHLWQDKYGNEERSRRGRPVRLFSKFYSGFVKARGVD